MRKLNRQQLKKSSLKIEKLIKHFIKYNIQIILKIIEINRKIKYNKFKKIKLGK